MYHPIGLYKNKEDKSILSGNVFTPVKSKIIKVQGWDKKSLFIPRVYETISKLRGVCFSGLIILKLSKITLLYIGVSPKTGQSKNGPNGPLVTKINVCLILFYLLNHKLDGGCWQAIMLLGLIRKNFFLKIWLFLCLWQFQETLLGMIYWFGFHAGINETMMSFKAEWLWSSFIFFWHFATIAVVGMFRGRVSCFVVYFLAAHRKLNWANWTFAFEPGKLLFDWWMSYRGSLLIGFCVYGFWLVCFRDFQKRFFFTGLFFSQYTTRHGPIRDCTIECKISFIT